METKKCPQLEAETADADLRKVAANRHNPPVCPHPFPLMHKTRITTDSCTSYSMGQAAKASYSEDSGLQN